MSENVKCPNHEFCNSYKVPGMGSDYCMGCGSWFKGGFGWDKLTIVDSSDKCLVCMDTCGRKLMFPTKCGHSFCLSCCRNILFDDEEKENVGVYGNKTCPLCRKKYTR